MDGCAGVRQLGVLFRKNVLLKTRRPCATCFELALPVVLFLLLAYTRAKYEIDTLGPFHFENNAIFPVSRMLFEDGSGSTGMGSVGKCDLGAQQESDSCEYLRGLYGGKQTVASCTVAMNTANGNTFELFNGSCSIKRCPEGKYKAWHGGDIYSTSCPGGFEFKTYRNGSSSSSQRIFEKLEHDFVCHGDYGFIERLADVFQPFLATEMSGQGKTLAAELLAADPALEADRVRHIVEELKVLNIPGELDTWVWNARGEYLNSEYPDKLLGLAKGMDHEVRALDAWLSSLNVSDGMPWNVSSAAAELQRCIERRLDNLCGADFSLSNIEELDGSLMSGTLNLESLLNGSQDLHWLLGELDKANLDEEFSNSNWRLNLGWPGLNTSMNELNKTMSNLHLLRLRGGLLSKYVEMKLEKGNLSWQWNKTALTEELDYFRRLLSSKNFTKEVEVTLDRTSEVFDTLESFANELRHANLSSYMDWNWIRMMRHTNLSGLVDWNWTRMSKPYQMNTDINLKSESVDFDTAGLEAVVVMIDDWAWWVSHFLRPNSSAGKLLGERRGDSRRLFAKYESSMRMAMEPSSWVEAEPEPEPETEQQHITRIVADKFEWNYAYKTELGAELHRLLKRLRDAQSGWLNYSADMQKRMEMEMEMNGSVDMNKLMERMRSGGMGREDMNLFMERMRMDGSVDMGKRMDMNGSINMDMLMLMDVSDMWNYTSSRMAEMLDEQRAMLTDYNMDLKEYLLTLIDDVQQSLSLALENRSVDQLEEELVPEFNEFWAEKCPIYANKTHIGQAISKLYERNPRILHGLARALANISFEEAASESRKHVENMGNISNNSFVTWLQTLQHELAGVNVSGCGDRWGDVIAKVQSRLHGLSPDSRAVAVVLAQEIRSQYMHYREMPPCSTLHKVSGLHVNMNLSAWSPELIKHVYESEEVRFEIYNSTMQATTPPIVTMPYRSTSNSNSAPDNKEPEDHGDMAPTVSGSEWMEAEIMRRKILIAPYVGEAKQLMDYLMVELSHSVTDETVFPSFLRPLLDGTFGAGFRGSLAMVAQLFLEDRMLTFRSESELESYAAEHADDVLAAIVFKSADVRTGDFPQGSLNIDYAIRMHAQLLPPTSRIVRMSRYSMFGGTRISAYPYIDLGFTLIQEQMARAAARLRAVRKAEADDGILSNRTEVGRNMWADERTEMGRRLEASVEQFPNPQYKLDRFIRVIQHTMPMMMILGWIYAVSLLVKEVVYEKQERLRDVMRIMGLKTWVYWISWVASAMVQLSVLVSIMVAIMSGFNVLKYSDWTVMFVFFWLYSLATVSLSMLISAFFSRAKVAAACAGLIYYVAYMPYAIYNRFEGVWGLAAKNSLCLMSSTGMGIGMSMVAKWELIEEGVQWSNVWEAPPVTTSGFAPTDNHCLGYVMVMFVIDSFIYQLFAWYIEKVFPGTLGLPQPWYFPFLPSYWGFASKLKEETSGDIAEGVVAEQKDHGNPELECWEAPPGGLDVAVQIRDLAKIFPGGKKALQGISLDMHKGTILGLLGHNGAGKSTTMSILTGLYAPTSGDVTVNGVSVRKDSHGVRKQLGVCLQHNALWENITVEEHLRLFNCLKCVPHSKIQEHIDRLLSDTGLTPKRHAPSRALSGGMKRKLSIGIALAGGSQVIALDEPTAGVDATSRRDIWQLLAAYKAERSILLSTHFMDEADILSDRISIIAEGRLTAIGSGMALKRHFADGYMLIVVRKDGGDAGKIAAAVREAVPSATFKGSRGRELSFTLPFESRDSFPRIFAKLQDPAQQVELGIETYGVSAATMEEVFLRASSVHEQGLKGQVRNQAIDVEENNSDSPSPSSEGDTSTKESSNGNNRTVSNESPSNSAGQSADLDKAPSDQQSTNTPPSADAFKITMEGRDVDEAPPPKPPVGQVTHEKHNVDEAPPKPPAGVEEAGASQGKTKNKKEKNDIMAQVVHEGSDKEKIAVKTISGPLHWMQQFGALFRKRALSVRRDRKAWASQLLLPTLFVLLALVVAKLLEVHEEEPPLKLDTSMFIGTTNAGPTTQSLSEHVIPFRQEKPGVHLGGQVAKAFESVSSTDRFQSVTANTTMEDYLLTHSKEFASTYGAVSVDDFGIDGIDDTNRRSNVTLWFKNQGYHAIPAMVNLWGNARLKLMGFDDTSLTVWSHPLPKTQQLLSEELSSTNQMFTDLTVAITVILAMGFIPASFVVYLVHEKSTHGKHQQLLTGVRPAMYWFSSYCWDMVNFLVPLIVCLLLFMTSEAYGGRNAPAVFLLLLLYGACMTPYMYCVEPIFSVPSTAYVTLICSNIFTGTVSVMAVTVLDLYQNEIPDLKPTNDFLKVFLPWTMPNYCLGRGMIDIAMNHYLNYASEAFGVCPTTGRMGVCTIDPLTYDVAGKFLLRLFLMSPVWLGLRLLIEWGFCTRKIRQRAAQLLRGPVKAPCADPNVQEEEDRVSSLIASGSSAMENLVIHNLAKSFKKRRLNVCSKAPTVHAVRGVSVGVPAGECFGLLGVNGAGKTTTMRMITGDTDIGYGDIFVGGWSVHGHRDRARQHLGYCPQFDALPDKLTVRETLALYARIRGVSPDQVSYQVETIIKRMCLEAHQKRLCEHLSGGNKRKLSTALALIGEPDVVLLDEPSTGVDVGARCFLWEVIGGIRQRGHAIILTSHSMEECEVLCTRLTIMVHGQMRCLGSPVQLKDKYGGGYTLSVKVERATGAAKQEDQSMQQVRTFVESQVPDAKLAEESVGLLRYRLGQGGGQVPLAMVFRLFNEATAAGGLLHGVASDYTVSQTSLEEVFLYFSHEAENTPLPEALTGNDGTPLPQIVVGNDVVNE